LGISAVPEETGVTCAARAASSRRIVIAGKQLHSPDRTTVPIYAQCYCRIEMPGTALFMRQRPAFPADAFKKEV